MAKRRRTVPPLPVALAISAAQLAQPRTVKWPTAVQESVATAPDVDAEAEAGRGNADDLERYWTAGKGAAKIRWGQSGSMDRCKRALAGKVADPGGLCATYHKVATGKWPSEKKDKNTVADAPAAGRVAVREATTGGATVASTGRLLVRLIRAGWSTNGNRYSAEVLRRAAQERMFAKGTLCYADHATDAEEEARPSGSIKSLAGVLETDARWDETEQALMAEVRLFAPWREPILDMAESIGMSIRAWVVGEHGEQDGRAGFLVEQIVGGRSVDFVTVPAAGGGIVSILEAVGNTVPTAEARNAGHWFEARIHAGFTETADRMFGDGYLTRPERIALSSAIGDALAAFAARVETDVPHLYGRDPWQEPESTTPKDAVETAPATLPAATAVTEDVTDGTPPSGETNQSEEEPAMSGTQTGSPPVQAGTVPVPDGGQPPTTPTVPPVPPNDPAPQPTSPPAPAPVEPAQESATAAALRAVTEQLAAMQQQFATLSARDAERAAEARKARNEHAARQAVEAAVAAVPAQWRAQVTPRVTAAVLAAVPTVESGEVDTIKLDAAVKAAVESEVNHCRTIQAQALEEAGVGLPSGLGGTSEAITDDGLDAELSALFTGSLGLSESAAKIAVKGRV